MEESKQFEPYKYRDVEMDLASDIYPIQAGNIIASGPKMV